MLVYNKGKYMPDIPKGPISSDQMLKWIESVKDQKLVGPAPAKSKKSPETPSGSLVLPEIKLEGDTRAQIERARTIMGADNFFGPEEIQEKYPYVRLPDTIPPIPFDQDRMERERKAGMVLRLVCDTAVDGQPLIGAKLNELVSPSYTARNEKLLSDNDWYKNEPFFTTETPRLAWVFMATELLADSTNKNYVDQTRLISGDIKTLWQGSQDKMPQQDRDDLKEWQEYYSTNFAGISLEEITDLLNDGTTRKKYAFELSNLGINQHNRPTFIEQLDHNAFMRASGKKILEKDGHGWTSTRSSNGFLVILGYAGVKGAVMLEWQSGVARADLGVLLVRR